MVVLRFHEAADETGSGKSTIAIESGCMSAELTEDGGTPNVSLRQLPAPETIAANGSGGEARGRRCRHLKRPAAPWRGQDQPRRVVSELRRRQAGSRRVARPGRAAYGEAVVAAARGLRNRVVAVAGPYRQSRSERSRPAAVALAFPKFGAAPIDSRFITTKPDPLRVA